MLYARTHAYTHTQQWDETLLFYNNPITVLQAARLINCGLLVSLQNSGALQYLLDQYWEYFSEFWKSTIYTYLI